MHQCLDTPIATSSPSGAASLPPLGRPQGPPPHLFLLPLLTLGKGTGSPGLQFTGKSRKCDLPDFPPRLGLLGLRRERGRAWAATSPPQHKAQLAQGKKKGSMPQFPQALREEREQEHTSPLPTACWAKLSPRGTEMLAIAQLG